MRRTVVLAAVIAVACASAAAATFEKGDKEVSLRLSYTDADFGSKGDWDFGSRQSAEVAVSHSWFVTDCGEVGLAVSHTQDEMDGGDFGPDAETDATGFGVLFQYNFRLTGILTPFIGIDFFALSGDVSEVYDYEISAGAGVKIYPFRHAGILASVQYSRAFSDDIAIPDADAIGVGAGLVLKY